MNLLPFGKNHSKAGLFIGNPHLVVVVAMLLLLVALYYANISFWISRIYWLWQIYIFEYVRHINGSLFYIPIIYSGIFLGWQTTIMVWILSTIIILPRVILLTNYSSAIVSNIIFLILPTAIIMLIILLLKWVQRERKIMQEREAERQAYILEIIKSQENERKRISRELHDEAIQTLLALDKRTESLLKEEAITSSPQIKQQIITIGDTLLQVSEELRRLSTDLRPSILDDLGLLQALRHLANNAKDLFNTHLEITGSPYNLPSQTETAIFRFVQEALNNVKKHACASRVTVSLAFNSEGVKVLVMDNGKGFDVPLAIKEKGKLGIVGMEERARLLGGTLKVHSHLGQGTAISVEFKRAL